MGKGGGFSGGGKDGEVGGGGGVVVVMVVAGIVYTFNNLFLGLFSWEIGVPFSNENQLRTAASRGLTDQLIMII